MGLTANGLGVFRADHPQLLGDPAAIGKWMAQAELPIAVGARLGTAQELATARQQRLGLPIVLCNDYCYSEIREA